jgi:hypothetical protein
MLYVPSDNKIWDRTICGVSFPSESFSCKALGEIPITGSTLRSDKYWFSKIMAFRYARRFVGSSPCSKLCGTKRISRCPSSQKLMNRRLKNSACFWSQWIGMAVVFTLPAVPQRAKFDCSFANLKWGIGPWNGKASLASCQRLEASADSGWAARISYRRAARILWLTIRGSLQRRKPMLRMSDVRKTSSWIQILLAYS